MKRYKAHLLRSAHHDILAARAWYRQHNPDLPKRFKKQIDSYIEKIKANPFAFAVRYKEVHICNMSTFPYAIHFLVQQDVIVIIAVHHTAINTEKWFERL